MWEGSSAEQVEGRLHPQGCVTHVEYLHVCVRWCGLLEPHQPPFPLDTSRRPKDSEREGQGYSFVSRAEMEADIRAGRYLEHGEYEGNLYGTRIDSIRGVVAAGKVCVLDVNPQVPPSPSLLILPNIPSGYSASPSTPPVFPGICLPNTPTCNPSTTARDPDHLDPFTHPPGPSTPLVSSVTLIHSHLPAVPLPFIPRLTSQGPRYPSSSPSPQMYVRICSLTLLSCRQ